MTQPIDQVHLLEALALALEKVIAPALTDPNALNVTSAARELAAYQALQLRAVKQGNVGGDARVSAADTDDLPGRLMQGRHEAQRVSSELAVTLQRLSATGSDRPPAPTEPALVRHLQANLGDPGVRLAGMQVAIGGYSKQTTLLDVVRGNGLREGLVIRRDLRLADVGTTVADEFDLLKSVHRLGLPVAEPLWLSVDDPEVPGTFLVSRQMPGQILGDPLGLRKQVGFDPITQLAALMAQLHAIDADRLTGYQEPRGLLNEDMQRHRIAHWEDDYERLVEHRSAVIEAGLFWLKSNAHLATCPMVLVHGEIGFHNILFHDGRISALLDWELAHPGNPAEDLAYVRRFVEPFITFEEFLTLYEEAGGTRPAEPALRYFEVFGNVRNAILGVKGIHGFNHGSHHDLPLARIIVTTSLAYTETLGALLGELIDQHGFHWLPEPA